MSTRSSVLACFFMTLLFLVSAWPQGSDSARTFYMPVDYTRKAQELIIGQQIEAHCTGQRIQIQLSEAASADAKTWYYKSFLERDVRRFNAEPEKYGWYFSVDNNCGLLSIDRNIHRIQLPFASGRRWLGRILLSDRAATAHLQSLDDGQRTLAVVEAGRPVAASAGTRTRLGAKDSIRSPYIKLFFGRGVSEPVGDTYLVGDQMVFNYRKKDEPAASGAHAKLLGYRIPEGRIASLRRGDWLRIGRADVSETFVYTEASHSETVSFIRHRNGKAQRLYRNDRLGLGASNNPDASTPYVEAFATAIDTSLQSLTTAEAGELSRAFDVRLSVRRHLQRELQSLLEEFLRKRQSATRVVSGGITVMDGLSGDVLALATFPTADFLRAHPVVDPRISKRLLKNQNLVRHPIGSAGKPFYFAAAGQAHPELLTLNIDSHEPDRRHQALFHCKLEPGYQLLSGHAGPIDFEKALEISCNKYTVELATLALSMGGGSEGTLQSDSRFVTRWPARGERTGIRLGKVELDEPPAFGHVMTDFGPLRGSSLVRCDGLDKLEQTDFADALHRLTRADVFLGRTPVGGGVHPDQFYRAYVTQRFDMVPIQSVLERVRGRRDAEQDPVVWQQRSLFTELVPERVNLAFNTFSLLRQDWVTALLGGGTSTWSNIQLAESASRLISGRALDARLATAVAPQEGSDTRTSVVAPQAPTSFAAPLQIDPEVREKVLRGLRRVVEGKNGTARRLRRGLDDLRASDPSSQYIIFSKTGSPIVERPVHESLGLALDALVPEYLFFDRGVVRSVIHPEVEWSETDTAKRAALSEEIAEALESLGFTFRRLPAQVLELLDAFQRTKTSVSWPSSTDLPTEIPAPLYLVGNRLQVNREDGLFTQSLVKGMGAVYFFSLVRLPRGTSGTVPKPESWAQPEARIVTVAIYVDKGPDSSLAVALARDIFDTIARWVREEA